MRYVPLPKRRTALQKRGFCTLFLLQSSPRSEPGVELRTRPVNGAWEWPVSPPLASRGLWRTGSGRDVHPRPADHETSGRDRV
jgi:hypothetical protein